MLQDVFVKLLIDMLLRIAELQILIKVINTKVVKNKK